jgi:hypothetical protein
MTAGKETVPSPTVTVGGRTFTILFPDLLRPLRPDERSELLQSICQRKRVLVPVVIDEEDGVIDGGHRLSLVSYLQLPIEAVPLRVERGLTLEQKAEMALSLNHGRRHLAARDWKQMADERRDRIKEAVKLRRKGMSTRDIAAETGVSEKRVRDDLAEATAKGYAVEPEGGVIHGRDGKDRSVAAPPGVSPETEESPDPDTDPDARQVRGKGVALAHDAINSLSRIPKNDRLRKRGFQIVKDWIRHNE